MILSVGNTKGGVGKSTLAMSLCNYLSKNKREVQLLDLGQNSAVMGLYQEELSDRKLLPYTVQSGKGKSLALETEFLLRLKNSSTIMVVDLPSSLEEKHQKVLKLSDIHLIPFEYSLLTIKSTMQYLNYLKLIGGNTKNLLVRWKLDSRRNYKNQMASDLMLSEASSFLMQPVYDFSSLTDISVTGMSKEQRKPVYRVFDELLVYIDEIQMLRKKYAVEEVSIVT
ncbi:ParA family protein [Chryseobacterium sp. A321]